MREGFSPDKFKQGKIIGFRFHPEEPVEQEEAILQCPYCNYVGTARHCKDFTLLTLGYYLCRHCGKTFTLFSKDWHENVKIAYDLLDAQQKRAVDSICKEGESR